MSLHAGRHEQQPVGSHQGGQYAGTARQRRGDDLTVHGPQPHPHPVVHAHDRRELACEPGRHLRPLDGRHPLEPREQRRREDVERQRRGHRVARHADHGGRVHDSENDGMAGSHGHAVDRKLAELRHHPCGVVVSPRARARDHEYQVRHRRSGMYLGADLLLDVRDDLSRPGLTSELSRLRDEHQRVGVEDLPLPRWRADRDDLVTGRDHRDPGLPAYDELGRTGRSGGGDVDRPQPMSLRQQQLARADVLPDRAHVLVRRHSGEDHGVRALAGVPGDVVHLLSHHDGVEPRGHGVARVDHRVVGRRQRERGGL